MKLTVPQYAKAEGISRQAAHDRLKRIGLRAGRGALIDADAVNAKWRQVADAVQGSRNPAGVRKAAAKPVAKPMTAATHREVVAPKPERDDSFGEAQRAKEWLSVKEKSLKLQQIEGKLVDRAETEAATERRIRADAEAVLAWPSRVSADIAAELGIEKQRVYAILHKHIRAFMQERSMAVLS